MLDILHAIHSVFPATLGQPTSLSFLLNRERTSEAPDPRQQVNSQSCSEQQEGKGRRGRRADLSMGRCNREGCFLEKLCHERQAFKNSYNL